ncbi:hypothetical protein B0H19DRAFT_1210101 [Mycena capillaripes]|nr:hypothetical protein B0H19DRAFT_1210101 [Mycena capillaripes]
MPPKKSGLWAFFHQGEKQNSAHYKAYCLACVETHCPAAGSADNVMDVDGMGEEPVALLATQAWFINAVGQTGPVHGERKAMIAYLIACPHASAAAKKIVKEAKGGKREQRDSDSDDEEPSRKRKWAEFTVVEKSMQQTQLKVFKGLNIPFSDAQSEMVRSQFLRATVSANLPFCWTINPEVIKLFLMFRSTATDVMPLDEVIGGRLLDEAAAKVDKEVVAMVKSKYVMMSSDGWKDKYSVTGVDISVDGKSYLVDLIHTRGKKKDGESMCAPFCDHIDKAERETGCIVVSYVCDNDGGSQSGRKLLVILRPWLLGIACCGHQARFRVLENEQAFKIAEETTDAIGWINNHEHVCNIFDEVQAQQNGGSILAYLMANLTRWTTHSIAFDRTLQLNRPLRQTAILRRDDIVAAQVGAEKNKKKCKKMEAKANKFCDLFDNPTFWKNLQIVLLRFAGVYLHFKQHANPAVAAGMLKRIEKRWAAMDQHFFIMAMAGVSVFTLRAVLMELYKCVKSGPPAGPLTPEQEAAHNAEKAAKETEVSQAFLKYMATLGVFADFEAQHADFQKTHGNNPVHVWQIMLASPDIRELADFAILILGIVRTRLRNRLSFQKTGKMSKVGASIRTEHLAAGFIKQREPRKNHDKSRVADLIAVPQYADLLEDEAESDSKVGEHISSRLVNSGAAWRKVYTLWAVAARLEEMEAEESVRNNDADADTGASHTVTEPPAAHHSARWLPCPLSRLFTGAIPQPPGSVLMELLAAEHSDEEPDDGELEGSGDDYDDGD